MKNNKLPGIITAFLMMIQAVLITGVVYVQRLTRLRAGVMRHVYQRRLQMEASFLTEPFLLILTAINLILAAVCLRQLSKTKINLRFYPVSLILALILSLWNMFVIWSPFFRALMAYPYFLLAFNLVVLIQFGIVKGSKNR